MPMKESLKLRMYEHIYRLNREVEAVLWDLKTLQDAQAFPRRLLRGCKSRLEQLRADANRELTQVLGICEAGDSAHFASVMAQGSARKPAGPRRPAPRRVR